MSCNNCNVTFGDYYSANTYTWCTNCGNYGVTASVKRALAQTNRPPKDTVLCFDIGCHGNGSDKINGYRFHGLHGRVLPLAAAVTVANSELTVIAHGGDGGTLSEGINHLIHCVRNNYNMVFILHNNENYGLTTGQASATTPQGTKMNASPDGVYLEPLNIADLVFSLNPSFYARGFSGDVNQLTDIIVSGIEHSGFSFIEVLQDCPTYNRATPHEWYLERVYDVTTEPDYNPTHLPSARELALNWDKIATGVIYQSDQPTFLEMQASRHKKSKPLTAEVKTYHINKLLDNYR